MLWCAYRNPNYRKPGSTRRYVRTHHHLKLPEHAAAIIDYIGGATSKLPAANHKLSIKETDFKQRKVFWNYFLCC